MARLLITGGSGRLGSAIRRIVACDAPTRAELDILSKRSCFEAMEKYDPEIVVHCAGFVNTARAETSRGDCWALNVEGTRNVARAAMGRRLVYISTDYVFDGEQAAYTECAHFPNPVNFYGISKLAGELIAGEHPDALILRAPFRADPPWRFARAFTDQWTSCDFVSVRAPQIVAAALTTVVGVLHIGGERRSVYDMARAVSPSVGPTLRRNAGVKLPRDTSLDSRKWQSLIAASVQ